MTQQHVSRAQRSAIAVRCRPGIVTNSEFGKAPDQQRSIPLRFMLRRIRGTYAAYALSFCTSASETSKLA
jgi:hypothetical protein